MKSKLFLVFCLALLLIVPGTADAARDDRNRLDHNYVDVLSTEVDLALVGRPAYIYGVTIFPSSSSLAYVKIIDNATAATGTVLAEVAETGQNITVRETYDPPINAKNGIYVDVTNGYAVVEYR